MRTHVWLSLALTLSALARPSYGQSGKDILGAAGVRGGLIVHVGCGGGELTTSLHANGTCLVHGLDVDPGQVARARDHIHSLGLHGKVTVDIFDGKTLPYINNLVNVLVLSTDDRRLSDQEIMRVVAPRGVVFVRQSSVRARPFGAGVAPAVPRDGPLVATGDWRVVRKPWPDELDAWTHWLHGPDNNAVSKDKKVGISRNLQWIMPPRWARHHNLLPSVSAMVSAGGRIYYIIDEGAVAVRGLPDKWRLVCRDAFNGLPLWKRPIKNWGWRTWSAVEFSGLMRFKGPGQLYRRLVAVDDIVYVTLGFDQPLVALDGATGKTIRQFAGTEHTSEILYHEGRLLLARNTFGKRAGKEILAVDANTGETLWKSQGHRGTSGHNDELKRYTDAYLTAGRDNVFFIDGDDIAALDLKSGKESWRQARPEMEKNVLGHYEFNHANLCTLVFHDGVLLLGQMFPFPNNLNARQQKAMTLRATDAQSGRTLWEAPGMSLAHFTPPDVFINDGRVWTMKMNDVSLLGLGLRTGEVEKEYAVKDMLVGHHHRCYRNKATERFYLAGEEGIEYIDFRSGDLDVHHWMRGACAYGIMPANGCTYLPTHSCGCHANAKLNGFIALTAEDAPPAAFDADHCLEKGPAFSLDNDDLRPSIEDWPVFKRDHRRSNFVPTSLPADLSCQWTVAVGGRPTAPVVAENRLYVTSRDSHELRCLDATTGEDLWRVTTNGALDTPPTIDQGRLIFGARTGFVGARRADDGRLIWRRRVAPADLRLTAHGQLESPWPVHGSALVMKDRVYCVAGRSMHLNTGLYAYVLDARSGEIVQQAQLTADTTVKGELKGSVLPDILVSDGTTIGMRTMRFSVDDISAYQLTGGGKSLAANDGGLLDDTWFNSAFWVYQKSRAQMLVFDDQAVFGIQAYDKFVSKSYPHDIFTPGRGYRVFAANVAAAPPAVSEKGRKRGGGKSRPSVIWEKRIASRAQAMAVTKEHLCLAGTPDLVDENDPWGAIEGRRGSELKVFAKEDGKQVGECQLDSVPVYDGMAVARGRLYVSMQDGTIVCLGEK